MKRSPLARSCCSTYKSKEITGIFSMTIKTKRRAKKYTEIIKRTVSEPVNVSAGVFGIPRRGNPKKGEIRGPDKCGDDSYNIFESETISALTVADGVGGLKLKFQDPATFARTLMKKTDEVLGDSYGMTPKQVLETAFDRLVIDLRAKVDEKLSRGGASTAVSVFIEKATGKLKCANIGDSCFMVFSKDKSGNWKSIFKSETECYKYNFPYEFSVPPSGEIEEYLIKITELELQLLKGDIVLIMSDGVSDNIFEEEIADVITETLSNPTENLAEALAENIAFEALKLSKLDWDTGRISPFSIESKKYKIKIIGGKIDDITIIASIIN